MADTCTIVTFNIHHAEGKDGVLDLPRVADFIAGFDADLVALQELDVGTTRARHADQAAELADLLSQHVYFASAIHMDPGEYGIALLAREEFKAVAESLPSIGTEERRVAIVANWRGVGVITTHLSRSSVARAAQTEHIAELTTKLGDPCLVLGDLNQPARDLGPFKERGLTPAKAKTSLAAALKPGWPIDHILTSKSLAVTDARTVGTVVSDHPALVARLHLS